MRRLIIAALSVLILLCTPFSYPQGCGLHSIRWTPLMINLLIRTGAPAAASPRPVAPPAHAPTSTRGAAPSTQESISLEPGKPVERKLSGRGSHSYKITINSGQYLHVVVAQQGIDVAVALFTPDGKKISEADSENLIEGSETLSAIAEATGAYMIEVRSVEKTAKIGRYEIKIEELRDATAEDKYRVAGELIFREAKRLQNGTLEAQRKGIEKYYEALESYRRASDRSGEAGTLNRIGMVYRSLGETREALEKFNEALSISRAIGARKVEAITLNEIGLAYQSLGETRNALEIFNEALPIFQAVGARSGEASAINNIGLAYLSLGETRKALEKLNEALVIFQAVGARRDEATTLSNIGGISWSLREMQKALEKYNEALSLSRSLGDRRLEAAILTNIGGVYDFLGELQKALEKYNEALPIRRAVGDRLGEAVTLHNIGTSYH